MDKFFSSWTPFIIALISLFINIVQLVSYHRVKNKISVWAKDAKSFITSIVGIQENIKKKKISSLGEVTTNMEILGNFANSMFLSLEEELGRKKREITIKKPKKEKK